MIHLRPYQKDAIKAVKDSFKFKDRQYIELPTGSGKTVTFLSYAFENHDKVLVIVPSRQLLHQVYSSALKFYDRKDISRKGDDYDEIPKRLHICIIHSLRGDYLDFLAYHPFDLTVIDEAHHSLSASYQRFISLQWKFVRDTYKKTVKYLGVTATPDRSDGLLMDDILECCTFKITILEMIHNKYLSDIEGFRVKTNIDISNVSSRNGDFNITELYKVLATDNRDEMIVNICRDHFKTRKTLIFCINIAHSKTICNLLNFIGLPAAHIDGKMDSDERNSILNSFRNGEISFICNCQLLTEGFDEPMIDGIVLARPTRSKSLFTQMIGRGLRNFPGKENCKIADIVDNHSYTKGFTSIVSDDKMDCLDKFKSINDIVDYAEKKRIELENYNIERVNFFSNLEISDIEACASMIDYLKTNNIEYYDPISFEEAAFLIWYNELKKEYYHGCT